MRDDQLVEEKDQSRMDEHAESNGVATALAVEPGPYGEPWRVRLVASGFADDGQPITGVWVESGWKSICSVIPHGNVRATANLIAAAPDLLAALKAVAMAPTCVCACGSDGFCDCGGELVRAAIAKAEGRS